MLITLVQGKVKDTANRLTDPEDYNAAISEALSAYSRVRPVEAVADIPGTGGHDVDLPEGWQADFSGVLAVEFPIGTVPETCVDPRDYKLYRTPAGIKLRLITLTPAITDSIRLTYTLRHQDETTVPAGDIEAVANKAAAVCCRIISAGYGQSSEPLIQADSVNYGDKVDSYRRLADALEKQFNDHLGLGDDTPVQAAMATAAPPQRRSRLTHLAISALLLASLAASGHAADTIGNDPWPVDLSVQAGEDFRARLTMRTYSTVHDKTGRVMNLTGYSFRAQAGASAPTAAPFATFSTVIVDPAAGRVDLSLSKGQTAKHAGKSGFWDLLQTEPGGAVRYLMKGLVKFLPTVSR